MKVIGVIKEVADDNYLDNQINYLEPVDISTECPPEMISIEYQRFYSKLWNGRNGREKIVASDELTQEIFNSQQEFQDNYLKMSGDYSELLSENEHLKDDFYDYQKKVNTLNFWKRLKFLFTKKIEI